MPQGDNSSGHESINREAVLRESEKYFERSISILNVVVTGIGVLVALLTLGIVILAGLGFFEVAKWKEIRKDIQKDATYIRNIRLKVEEDLNELRTSYAALFLDVRRQPSEEIKAQLDDIIRRLEIAELFGAALKSEDYLSRAVGFYYQRQYELALKGFEKAIQLKPDSVRAWTNKTVTLHRLGRYNESLIAAEKAVQLEPDSAWAWSNKSAALSALDRHNEGLEAADKAIELDPNSADAWVNKAANLLWLKRYDEGVEAADKAIELDPNSASAWANKAANLCRLGQYPEAAEAAERAIQLVPEFAVGWYNLACIYAIWGKKDEMLLSLQKAIELNPSYRENAKKDKDFERYWEDKDFKNLVD